VNETWLVFEGIEERFRVSPARKVQVINPTNGREDWTLSSLVRPGDMVTNFILKQPKTTAKVIGILSDEALKRWDKG
jgi:hypothetical protein